MIAADFNSYDIPAASGAGVHALLDEMLKAIPWIDDKLRDPELNEAARRKLLRRRELFQKFHDELQGTLG